MRKRAPWIYRDLPGALGRWVRTDATWIEGPEPSRPAAALGRLVLAAVALAFWAAAAHGAFFVPALRDRLAREGVSVIGEVTSIEVDFGGPGGSVTRYRYAFVAADGTRHEGRDSRDGRHEEPPGTLRVRYLPDRPGVQSTRFGDTLAGGAWVWIHAAFAALFTWIAAAPPPSPPPLGARLRQKR